MRRRQVLAGAAGALPAALAGCLADPPTTPAAPTTPPNIIVGFEWLSERPAYRVTFRRGNRLTADNTGILAVIADAVDERTVWVRAPDPDGRTEEDAPATVGSFPLTPGPDTTLVQQVPGPTTIRVVWTSPSRDESVSVDVWEPDEQPIEVDTTTPTAEGDLDRTDGTPRRTRGADGDHGKRPTAARGREAPDR
jgi:hypothetical protein